MRKFLFCIFLIQFLIFRSSSAQEIRGRVVSADTNDGLPGVSVASAVKGKVTQTDSKGEFSITVPSQEKLTFVYVGYHTQTITIANPSSFLLIKLQPGEEALKEVVITGYSKERRTTFSGAAGIITARQINQVPVGSFEQAMQGNISGTYVTAGSGQPGSASKVIVRGVGTINGSTNPLFIMDGVPVEPAINYGINSSDIASITVLKDASASALYGSRGSNGVVVITTKTGKNGPLTFNYKPQLGFAIKSKNSNVQMLNSAQRLQFEEEVGLETQDTWSGVAGWFFSDKNPANKNLSETQKTRYAAILDSMRNINTDWQDIFFRTGKFQEHEVSASGGNEKVRFYSSLNYFDQEGIAERSYLKRYFFRTNLDFNEKRLSGNLRIGAGLARTSGVESENSSDSANPFAAAYYALPYESPYVNGTLYHSGNRSTAPQILYDAREGSGALERLNSSSSASDYIKGLISGGLNYKLTDELTASTAFGLDFRDVNFVRIVRSGTYSGSFAFGGQGSYYDQTNRNFQYVSSSGLNFLKSWNDKHTVDIKGLFEINKLRFKSINFTGYGINSRLTETPAGISNGATTPSFATGSKTRNSLVSWIGIGKYSYNNKYIATLTYRYDGSSIVVPKNRWAGFYSTGFVWNASNEDFLNGIGVINDLKFRASYGKTASLFPGNFNSFSTYEITKYSGSTGITVGNPGNPDYDWEISKQLNLGVDFSVLNNRITGSFDWYNKVSSNLFLDEPLSSTSGFATVRINDGKMRNRGIEGEFAIEAVKYQDFSFQIGGNFNYNENEVLDLGDQDEFILGTTIVKKGLPFGTQYAVKWAGVDPDNGNALYYNRDGSKTTLYDPTNQNVTGFGSYIPPFQGGFFSQARYGNFSVRAQFSFASNYYRFNNEHQYNESVSFITSNKSTAILRRWRNPGDITDIQRYDKSSVRRLSSKDIEDASYIKLRNVRIGYNLDHHLCSKLRLKDLMIYAQGQNLYTWTKWTGFDPEDNNNIALFEYPNPRTFTLGLNVNF